MDEHTRESAEAAYKAVSDDLRFADAKALFVAIVIGAWISSINYAVGFKYEGRPELVRWLLLGMLFFDAVGLFLALLAIWPKIIRGEPKNLHLAVVLRKLNKKYASDPSALVTEMKRRFSDKDGDEGYEASLLKDLVRIGHRCASKYLYVRYAAVAGAISFVLGLIAAFRV